MKRVLYKNTMRLFVLLFCLCFALFLPLKAWARRMIAKPYGSILPNAPSSCEYTSGEETILKRGSVTLEALVDMRPDDFTGYAFIRIRASNSSDKKVNVTMVGRGTYTRFAGEVCKNFSIGPHEEKLVNILYPNLALNKNAFSVYIDGQEVSRYFLSNSSDYCEDVLLDAGIKNKDVSAFFSDFLFDGRSSRYRRGRGKTVNYDFVDNMLCDNWLFYSCFKRVVLRASALRKLSIDKQNALYNYARAGGVLGIVKDEAFEPPKDFVQSEEDRGCKVYLSGFGTLYAAASNVFAVSSMSKDSAVTNFDFAEKTHTNLSFKEPWGFVSFYCIAFAVIAGPLAYFILHKANKKIYLFVVVPVLSLVCCIIAGLYYLFFFKDQTAVAAKALTVLNQAEQQSVTRTKLVVCTISEINELLHFKSDTGIFVKQKAVYGDNDGIKINLDNGQALLEYLESNINSALLLTDIRKSRENIAVLKSADGLSITNGLGSFIEEITLFDKDGAEYWQTKIAPGETKKCVKNVKIKGVKPCSLAETLSLLSETSIERIKSIKLPRSAYLAKLKTPHFSRLNARLSSCASATAYVLGILENEQ